MDTIDYFGRTEGNYVIYDDLYIARCCRDWPHIPYIRSGLCGLCRRVPTIIKEGYKRKIEPASVGPKNN